MFTLLSQLWAKYTRRDEYSILILGLDGAGKSTFLERIKQDQGLPHLTPDLIPPTIGQNSISHSRWLIIVGKFKYRDIKFQVWDLGGQEPLRELWKSYLLQSHAICYIIDSTTPSRLLESSKVLAATLSTSTMPVLISANKQDIEGALSPEEVMLHLSGSIEVLDPSSARTIGTSGITGQGLEECLEWLYRAVRLNATHRPPN